MKETILLLSVRPVYVRVPPALAADHMRVSFEIPLGGSSTFTWNSLERLVSGEAEFSPNSPWRVPVDLDPLKASPEIVATVEDDVVCFGPAKLRTAETAKARWIGRVRLLNGDGIAEEGYIFCAVRKPEQAETPVQDLHVQDRILDALAALYNRKVECAKLTGEFREAVMAGVKKRSDHLTSNLDACAVGMLVLHVRILEMPKLTKVVPLSQTEILEENEYLAEIPGTSNLVSLKSKGMPFAMRQVSSEIDIDILNLPQ